MTSGELSGERPVEGAPRVGILGTGLMGTSIGLAAARAGCEVRGFDPDPHALAAAMERIGSQAGSQSRSSAASIEECAGGSDAVFVCAPVPAIPRAVAACLAAAPEAVVSDVGSVKAEIVEAVQANGPLAARFVGGHPMAGSERSGPEAASAALLEGAAWVLTPGPTTAPETTAQMAALVVRLGARPIEMSPDRHDRLVALVSHLPQMVSAALMVLAAREQARDPGVLDISGGGFRDLTRLAASNPQLWAGILRSNRAAAGEALDRFGAALDEFRVLLASDDGSLEQLFDEARRARAALERSGP